MLWWKRLFTPRKPARPDKQTASPPNSGKSYRAVLPSNLEDLDALAQRLDARSKTLVDHLGPAALAGQQCREAVKNGNYDLAWSLMNDQKSHYMQHANQFNFTVAQTIALDASIHKGMANVLRLENRHKDALTHILYWAIGSGERHSASRELKIRPYLNRCKTQGLSLDEVLDYVNEAPPDFRQIQDKVREWTGNT